MRKISGGLFLGRIMTVVTCGMLCDTVCARADTISNLVAYYPFSGNAVDSTGNGHDGTVFGATLTADRFGSPQAAYNFDGNDRLDVPDSPALTLGANPFTLAAWVQLSEYSTGGGYYLMGHSDGPGSTNKWIFFLGNTGISFVVGPFVGAISLGSADFKLDRWYHVAITRVGDTLTAYVDGAPIGAAQLTVSIPDPVTALQIGTAETGHPERLVRGSVDEVRIYSRGLSSDDIRELAGCPIPIGECLNPGKASFQVNEKKPGKEKLKVVLKNLTGATTEATFGNPVSGTTSYTLCIYDQDNVQISQMQVGQAGQLCDHKPCWKASKKGYNYADKTASADGITNIVAKGGDPGKGEIDAKGQNNASKGKTSLPVGIASALQSNSQATVRIITSDASCFAATMTNVTKADGVQFKTALP